MIKKTSITDIPRDSHKNEKDHFGIEQFEKGLTKFINSTNTPITIALQGEWGSGKTSMMNSLQKNLSQAADSKYHSVWLNTWEFALMKDAQNTLIDIITELIRETTKIAKIDENNTTKILKKLWGLSKLAVKVAANTAAEKTLGVSSEIVDDLLE